MEKPGVLNFEVGQLAEMRTFEKGFRSAWFKCKIKDIQLEKNKIWLEYYDYDSEEPSWEDIYQVPPYGKRSKQIKSQLMVRPQYPLMYTKSEVPPVNTITQACVVTCGKWKVGDLVDWLEEGCYWSARVIKLLSDDKVQIELPKAPVGERKKGEEGKHEAFYKDLRPFLDWSETEGWTLPIVDGRTSCDAQLIFPTKQGMDLEVEHAAAASAGSPVNASSIPRTSAEGDRDRESEPNDNNVNKDLDVAHAAAATAATVSPVNASSSTTRISAAEGDRDRESEQHEKNVRMDLEVEHVAEATASPLNAASSTTQISAEGDRERESEQNEKNLRMNCDLLVESSESTSGLRVGKRKAADEVGKRDLNIMHEDTLEAVMLDLEELVNKVQWMQRILQSPTNDAATSTSSWKFA